jgi:hypothetical protein
MLLEIELLQAISAMPVLHHSKATVISESNDLFQAFLSSAAVHPDVQGKRL